MIETTRNSSEDEIPKVTSLYFATPLAFSAPMEGFPWDDLRNILHGGQRMAKVHSGDEIYSESFNRLSTAHERYRQQMTDGFAIAKTRR